MSNEHIKEYPLCFRAYLKDVKNEMVFTAGSESVFPESYIGSYLKWFIEKKGFNNLETQLKEALAIIEKTNSDYWFMINLIERYSSSTEDTLKDCLDRMKFRKPLYEKYLEKYQEKES